MPTQLDYYAILQVNRNATQDDIERAYERLSAQYDPATSRKPRAAQKHSDIQAAYETLGDRDKRREYDRVLRSDDRTAAGALLPADVLSNRFILVASGTLIASIIAIVAVIILFGGDGGGEKTVATTSTASPGASVTAAVAPETPPAVSGEEVTLDSGLTYIDIVEGAGAEATVGDQVAVNYTGWLQSDGTMFDSSLPGGEPFGVTIGAGGVIQGWDIGLQGMKVGGERRLIIPPDLAYGADGTEGIPGGSTLIFDITLEDILISASSSPAASATPTAAATPEESATATP